MIPNSDLYTSPVIVHTAFPHRREQIDMQIVYGDDYEAAANLFRKRYSRSPA
ncbi:hypothetical protein [Sphingomonas sp.]|uniref:hypothetical protein n=1 Tax=Sphingomonas sp. TaxID=28214 RepID=UPI003B00C768